MQCCLSEGSLSLHGFQQLVGKKGAGKIEMVKVQKQGYC